MDVKDLFRGALSLNTDEDGFIMPIRFTEKQLARYSKLPNGAYAQAPAGVIMDLYTDASEISFDYAVYKSWTTMYSDSAPTFDVWENHRLAENLTISYSDEGNVHSVSYCCKNQGEKHITVVFPANAVLAVGNFKLGNFRPAERPRERVLVLGDSVSQGFMNNSASNNYPFLLCRFLGAELLNQSVGGEYFCADALDETGFQPDRVIVALGTNDMVFVNNYAKTQEGIAEYFAKLRTLYGDKKITVITPTALTDEDELPESKQLLLKISECAAKTAYDYGCDVVNGRDLLPCTKRYYSDNLHPNDLGFAHYTLNLIKAIL